MESGKLWGAVFIVPWFLPSSDICFLSCYYSLVIVPDAEDTTDARLTLPLRSLWQFSRKWQSGSVNAKQRILWKHNPDNQRKQHLSWQLKDEPGESLGKGWEEPSRQREGQFKGSEVRERELLWGPESSGCLERLSWSWGREGWNGERGGRRERTKPWRAFQAY